jgi:hypothetical protein
MQMRVAHELRQAEASRLARAAGAQQWDWLSRLGRRLACELGYLLVTLGARLEPEQPGTTAAASK